MVLALDQSQAQEKRFSIDIEYYRYAYLARTLDEKLANLSKQNKGGAFHLFATGHEIIGSVCGKLLKSGVDWALPYYRDRAVVLPMGVKPHELMASFMARSIPHHSGGRMMPEHFSDKSLRIPCQSSVVGSQFLQACGVALGVKLSAEEEIVYVSGGDGATSQGDFHEALNFASIHQLPVVFVIQDNDWAISVSLNEQSATKAGRGFQNSYENLFVQECDGCDIEDAHQTVAAAYEYSRKGKGPSLVVAKVVRMGPHSSSDDPKKYKTDEDFAHDLSLDPIKKLREKLLTQGVADEEVQALEEEVKKWVDAEAVFADSFPVPEIASAQEHVFAPSKIETIEREEKESESVVMMDALNAALKHCMREDQNMIVFGQDVAYGKGGVFGITKNLSEEFGSKRCFNSPLAESTIVGVATGLSMHSNYTPVVEIQFSDYMWTGINQLVNELSSMHYRSNGEWNCPVVVRMPIGGYIQGGPYHSQSVEGFLAHAPGLKIVVPSNAEDAYRLLHASIKDPNPVVFLEHKALYRQRSFAARSLPAPEEIQELGKAKVVKEGEGLTVITWGLMVGQSLEMIRALDLDVELIDLRTIVPLDYHTIEKSVKKTGKVLIIHEASLFGGFGGEISAWISEHLFEYLDAPPRRVGAKHCPVPYDKGLEEAVLPSKEALKEAILSLYNF